jgi:hypothetical protein
MKNKRITSSLKKVYFFYLEIKNRYLYEEQKNNE